MIRLIINGNTYTECYLNWNEVTDTLSRSDSFHGNIISKTIEVQLIGGAYKEIKAIDDEFDMSGTCTLIRQSYNSSDGWVNDFSGFVDFKSINYSTEHTQTENTASKNIINTLTISAYSNEFANKLLERMDIEVPYDRLETLDGATITPFANEYIEVDIEGIEAVTKNTLSIVDSGSIFSQALTPSVSNSSTLENWNSVVLQDVGGSFGASGLAPNEEWVNDRMWFQADNNDGSVPLQGNISGTITVTYTVGGSGSNQTLRIYDYKELLPIPVATIGGSGGWAPFPPETVEIPIDYDYDQDSRLVFVFSSTDSFTNFSLTENNLVLVSIADSTPCNFVPVFELGQRIIESITGQTLGLKSPFLGRTDSPVVYTEDGLGSLYFITNGKLIRQFPTGYITTDEEPTSQLSCSLKDWFESLDKIFCLGAGVIYEDGQYKLYVDDRKEFYKTNVVVELDRSEIEIDTYTKEKDLSLYYNEIEIGSNYEKPEEASGLREYNSLQNYSSPILHENKLDLLNRWIYAAYPFEFARRKPFNEEETTDYKYDNDNFIFNVYRSGATFVQNSAQDFDAITGLEYITSYINLNITPKRILKERYGWIINTGMKGFQDDYLKYNTSDIVTDLATKKASESDVIVENSDILISDLESPKFTGKIVRFQAPVNSQIFKSLQSDPYGLIKSPDLINNQDGYINAKEVSTNLVDKTTNWEGWEITEFSEDLNIRLLQDGSYRLLEDDSYRLLED